MNISYFSKFLLFGIWAKLIELESESVSLHLKD